tara:strand:+ start:311 stop:589 length:279 start_codon:yes stop_codon:yes gene_type:complete
MKVEEDIDFPLADLESDLEEGAIIVVIYPDGDQSILLSEISDVQISDEQIVFMRRLMVICRPSLVMKVVSWVDFHFTLLQERLTSFIRGIFS